MDSSRTPHGVRGLKSCNCLRSFYKTLGRTPHGVRGLKYRMLALMKAQTTVAPLTGCVD